MWFLTLHRWTGDRQEAIRSSLDDHLAWMRKQQLAGKVLIAGPTPTRPLGLSYLGTCLPQMSMSCAARSPSSPAGIATAR